MKYIVVPAVAVCLILAGCSKGEGPFANQSPKWYYDHAEKETTEEVKWCENQHGESKLQSCVDAVGALQQYKTHAWLATPPSHGKFW